MLRNPGALSVPRSFALGSLRRPGFDVSLSGMRVRRSYRRFKTRLSGPQSPRSLLSRPYVLGRGGGGVVVG